MKSRNNNAVDIWEELLGVWSEQSRFNSRQCHRQLPRTPRQLPKYWKGVTLQILNIKLTFGILLCIHIHTVIHRVIKNKFCQSVKDR